MGRASWRNACSILVIDEKKVLFVQSDNIGAVKMWAGSMYKLMEFVFPKTLGIMSR